MIKHGPRIREFLNVVEKNPPDFSLGLDLIKAHQTISKLGTTLLSIGTPKHLAELLNDKDDFRVLLANIVQVVLLQDAEKYVQDLEQIIKAEAQPPV